MLTRVDPNLMLAARTQLIQLGFSIQNELYGEQNPVYPRMVVEINPRHRGTSGFVLFTVHAIDKRQPQEVIYNIGGGRWAAWPKISKDLISLGIPLDVRLALLLDEYLAWGEYVIIKDRGKYYLQVHFLSEDIDRNQDLVLRQVLHDERNGTGEANADMAKLNLLSAMNALLRLGFVIDEIYLEGECPYLIIHTFEAEKGKPPFVSESLIVEVGSPKESFLRQTRGVNGRGFVDWAETETLLRVLGISEGLCMAFKAFTWKEISIIREEGIYYLQALFMEDKLHPISIPLLRSAGEKFFSPFLGEKQNFLPAGRKLAKVRILKKEEIHFLKLSFFGSG